MTMLSQSEKRELLQLMEERARRATVRESLPRDWVPRDYQKSLWNYLTSGGKRAVETWHRRAGKDEIALHWTCRAMHERAGNYWHMLPQANQARKAIWNAVNPHTGKRRIDEAFPIDLRENTREDEMWIRMKCGSTWQVLGSDNFDSLVGSPPLGIVFSEWALANPRAWTFMRPILDENGGWALFISTPRGRNHMLRFFEMGLELSDWHAEKLTAADTGVFTEKQLERIKFEMIQETGNLDDAEALFSQEYFCSFDAPLLGAYYAKLIAQAEDENRIKSDIPIEPGVPVETAWDLGWTDDTCIWWYQVVGKEIRILDFYSNYGEGIEHYANVIHSRARERGFDYGDMLKAKHWVPWDARPKTLASDGRSILEQFWTHGVMMSVAPNLSKEDGIQAVRQILPRCYFDKERCDKGIEALRSYQREWDEDRQVYKKLPLHNWASHPADSFRMLAVALRERVEEPEVKIEPIKGLPEMTYEDLFEELGKAQDSNRLI